VIEFDPAVPPGHGATRARQILQSGAALAKMNAIIDAQGRRGFDWRAPPLGALTAEVAAEAAGVVAAIDCERIARIARLAGAPKAPGAGVDLMTRPGDRVARGAPLYRIHATSAAELGFALQVARRGSAYRVEPAAATSSS
jgi:thymidine phosphorylase